MKFLCALCVSVMLAGCSNIPEAFFTKDKNFSMYGLYAVHPTYGVTGLGAVTYESKSDEAVKLKETVERIDALEGAVKYLIQKYLEDADKNVRAPSAPKGSGF